MQVKNYFDEIRQSVNEKEKEIIKEKTAEATRIRELDKKTKTTVIDLQAIFVRDTEAIEERKNMNDIDLYTTGIELTRKWNCWRMDIVGQCFFTEYKLLY